MIKELIVYFALIPGNGASFLRVDANNTELVIFFSDAHYDSCSREDKLIITDGGAVLRKPLQSNSATSHQYFYKQADS